MPSRRRDLLLRSFDSLPAQAPEARYPFPSIVIDLESIAHNVRSLRRLTKPSVRFCAVVKANAYGHGIVPVAQSAVRAGADSLAIGSVDEAVELRAAGIEAPCLKVIPSLPEEMETSLEAGVEEVVCGVESARRLARTARRMRTVARVHINVDTGMGRQGIPAQQAVEKVVAISRFRGLQLVGLMTHFAEADAVDPSFTEEQIRVFESVVNELAQRGVRPGLVHAANSAGLIHFPRSHFSMVRPGIAIYGVNPTPGTPQVCALRPAMSFRTTVAQVRELPAGSPISYGRTFQLERPGRIATLRVGYADGFFRSLSNRGKVIIGGRRHPIVGRVTMNLTNVQISDEVPVVAGDEAVLLGSQGDETVSPEELADWAGTIPYELLTSIGGPLHMKQIRYTGLHHDSGRAPAPRGVGSGAVIEKWQHVAQEPTRNSR
jgi:alanine racemase